MRRTSEPAGGRAGLSRRRALALTAAVTALAGLAGAGGVGLALAHGAGQPPDVGGLRAFLGGDFGGLSRATLETNALPYKVVATALLLEEEERRGATLGAADLPAVFARFGFVTPERVVGWPDVVDRPGAERPVGLLTDIVRGPVPGMRVEAATLGCAACHAGVTYDATGAPTRTLWPGLPNSSLDLEAYAQAVYRGLQRADADRGAFRRHVGRVFPSASTRERLTLRLVLQPAIGRRLAELRRAGDRPLPFSNGGAGRTNGAASLARLLGQTGDSAAWAHAVGFTSIPDLAGRGLRSTLLYDGAYVPRGGRRDLARDTALATAAYADSLAAVVAFFTVPTMGVAPDAAERAIPEVRPVMRWLVADYAPPPFPGAIDPALERRGAALFAAGCAQCHGTYADGPPPRRLVRFPNRVVPQAAMGTDPMRWQQLDDSLLARLGRTAYARHVEAARTGGYVAPILSGLWATAPYLHNGSVPTLWQLLTPAERPVAFQVGGHRLDLQDVGIDGAPDVEGIHRYPAGYRPWSQPELYDTRRPGLSNRGHEREFLGLGVEERRALIEYLKTL